MPLRSRRSFIVPAVCALISAVVLQAVAHRHNINPDTVSYFDVASAYRAGDLRGAINGYWSPLVSWIFAGTFLLRGPLAPINEALYAHVVMVGVFVVAFAALEFAVREAYEFAQSQVDDRAHGLSLGWFRLAGYSLLAWATLELISVEYVGPDLLVSAFIYVDFALLFRMARGRTNTLTTFGFGLSLGAAYLTKAVMFPVGLVSLIAALGVLRWKAPRPQALRSFAIATIGFVLVAGPWIAVLSQTKGYPTFGGTGKLNYAWQVDGVPTCCWQGEGNAGKPIHPPRQIFDSPATFEFATPIRATFPLWYDATYWYEGVTPPVHPVRQAWLFLSNLASYFPDFAWLLTFGALAGALVFRKVLSPVSRWYWILLVLAAVPFGLYALVGTETRYVGGSAVVVCLVVLAGMRPTNAVSGAALRAIILAIVVPTLTITALRVVSDARFLIINLATDNSEDGLSSRWKIAHVPMPPSIAIARDLMRRGVPEGAGIGTIGDAGYAYWARLAHLQVMSQLQWREGFWANDSTRAAIVDAMRRAGAQLIVCDTPPEWANTAGWETIAGTSAVLLDLRAPTATTLRVGASSDR
jgi:hypothetical protein